MLSSDYILDLCGVSYTGQVENGKKIFGTAKTGVILKDLNMTVHSGEVMAILGSKGSGKRAVLDVISRRAKGVTRGFILLNGNPLSQQIFQQRCGYVAQRCDLIHGLTVQQTLTYTPTILRGYLKSTKVKQVLADLALSQVAHKRVENLNKSEYRRLAIGIQLVRDPVMLLLDEPTWDLDPLNTYLIISILSNTAKKTGCGIVLSLEKPRSDVFPFLDRALYLCLGGVVYSGGTRAMLEYFHNIGFPCPQMENPLMYYLCLSTVDRRSRERFIESNQQIEALVERFRQETPGGPIENNENLKIPLAYGKPGELRVIWDLYTRYLAATFSCSLAGTKQLVLRLLLMPILFFILWVFYHELQNFQRAFITKTGLIFNMHICAYMSGVITTILLCTVPGWRTRYYQESWEGLYSGSTLLFASNLISLPFSLLSSAAATSILYPLLCNLDDPRTMTYMILSIWSCYIFAEQLTTAILMVIKCPLNAVIFSVFIICVLETIASGELRSFKGMPDWMYSLTYVTHTRYSANVLYRLALGQPSMTNLPYSSTHNCTNTNLIETSNFNGILNGDCKYSSGSSFLMERFSRSGLNGDSVLQDLEPDFNIGLSFAFSVGFILFNFILYIIPLPTSLKTKFRE